MRVPWPNRFPPVFIHAHWSLADSPKGPALEEHRCYDAAKRQGSVLAALQIVEDLYDEDVLDRIVDCFRDMEPIVVAPATRPEESKNALAISYAQWVARELNIEVCETIFQGRDVKRDKMNFWYRIANQPSFYGDVPPGRDFIIVDDVFTLGGTLAGLRGFIETNDSRVICMSALAHRSGAHVEIALDNATHEALSGAHGVRLDNLLREELGYETDCLTLPEAQGLLRSASFDELRAAIHGARDLGDAR